MARCVSKPTTFRAWNLEGELIPVPEEFTVRDIQRLRYSLYNPVDCTTAFIYDREVVWYRHGHFVNKRAIPFGLCEWKLHPIYGQLTATKYGRLYGINVNGQDQCRTGFRAVGSYDIGPSHTQLAAADRSSNEIRIWNLGGPQTRLHCGRSPNTVAWDPTGKWLACATIESLTIVSDMSVVMFSTPYKTIPALKDHFPFRNQRPQIAWHPKEARVVAGLGGYLIVWAVGMQCTVAYCSEYARNIFFIQFDASGTTLVVHSSEGLELYTAS